MKYYDAKFIKEFIEKNKDEIDCVSCGMKGDWFWTADDVFKNGEFCIWLENKKVKIAGIYGSYWATPVTVDDSVIDEMKSFAKMTGGMDDVTETI